LTPKMVHYGQAEEVIEKRRIVLENAYRAHPERFFNGKPKSQDLPSAAWINKPDLKSKIEAPEIQIAQ